MWLELPKREQLEDGRIMVSDSFAEILKLKAQYGDRFEIELCETNMRKDGYIVYPFYTCPKENTPYFDKMLTELNFIFIIPECYRKFLKPGRYVPKKYENTPSSLEDYIENVNTKDRYNAQSVGGPGDKEYEFLEMMLDYEDAIVPSQHALSTKNTFYEGNEMVLPLCVKRIGYILPEK